MCRIRRTLCVGGVIAALLVSLAPPASARTITFGANLSRAPDSPYSCDQLNSFGYTTCSFESINFSTHESGFPPLGRGRITSFRVRVGPTTGPMQIVVEEALRVPDASAPGGSTYVCCKAMRASRIFTPRANAITRIRTNLRVVQSRRPNRNGVYVDDHLVLSVLAPGVPIPASFDPNATLTGWFPAWNVGEERTGPAGFSGATILFNATWTNR